MPTPQGDRSLGLFHNVTNSHDVSTGLLFRTQKSSAQTNGIQIEQLSSTTSPSPSPKFGEVQAAPGDDLTPINGVTDASKMNGVAVPVSSSAGWSTHAPRECVYPSAVDYAISVSTSDANVDSLKLQVTLEYENEHFDKNETMVVKVAAAKSHLCHDQELALVSTHFQEWVHSKWVDITAQIDYTNVANEIVDAVLSDPNCGQTAAKATVTPKTTEVTLGPFSHRARLILVYRAEQMYTYQAMSLDGKDIGARRLCPLLVAMPFSSLDHEAGLSKFSVSLVAPTGTEILPIDTFHDAYVHLKNQPLLKPTTLIAVSDLVPREGSNNQDGGMGCNMQWSSLPPRACGILFWMSLPNAPDEDDFIFIGREMAGLGISNDPAKQGDALKAVIQVPSNQETPSLQVPLPGHGPMGNLLRVQVTVPKVNTRTVPCCILNLNLSDKSGSTARRVTTTTSVTNSTTTTTMRQRFNEMAELRFLKRLESIPVLVRENVLLLDDVWMDIFLPFDHTAPHHSTSRVFFRVGDVVDSVESLVAAIRANTHVPSDSSWQSMVQQHVSRIRSVVPGALTDFSVAPKTTVQFYAQWISEAVNLSHDMTLKQTKTCCTFIEFDTDGGHNGAGDYLQSLKKLREVCQARNGIVTGFGSWLNQDCASKVAHALGSSLPAQLALDIPEPGSEGLELIFRRGFAAWIRALRQAPPVTLRLSAGGVSFHNGLDHSTVRHANAMEVLAVQRLGGQHDETTTTMCKFGPPDVSNPDYSITVLENVPAADKLLVYLVSRLDSAAKLATALEVKCSHHKQSKASVSLQAETSEGDFLAYDWLKTLTTKSNSLRWAPLLSTSLRSRVEDEVSFRFNMASPSGSTSYLGRSVTVEGRAPIDTLHQPDAPKPPVQYTPRRPYVGGHQGGLVHGGLFGAASPGVTTMSSEQRSWSPPPSPPPSFRREGESRTRSGVYRGSTAPSVSLGTAAAAPPAARKASLGAEGASPFEGSRDLFYSSPRLTETGASPFSAPPPSRQAQAPGSASFLFGSPAPAPAPGAFAAIPLGFAPAPSFSHMGPQVPAAKSSLSKNSEVSSFPTREDPLWTYVINIPIGASHPAAGNLHSTFKEAVSRIHHTRRRLQDGDATIQFVCDVCHTIIASDHDRFHCLDCEDFDTCANCRSGHRLRLHRLTRIAPTSQTTPAEDPLVSTLLNSPNVEEAHSEDDRTVAWITRRLHRFLLTVMDWWPLFRSLCASRDSLPSTVSADLLRGIYLATTNGSVQDLLETTKTVVDSIVREEGWS